MPTQGAAACSAWRGETMPLMRIRFAIEFLVFKLRV
jgi:hypothetical protein